MQPLGLDEETKNPVHFDPVRFKDEKRVFHNAGVEFPAKNAGSCGVAEAGNGEGQRREKEFRERVSEPVKSTTSQKKKKE